MTNQDSNCAHAHKHRLIPTLAIKGADKAIEQYKKAFGAVEAYRMACPKTGAIMHACLKFGETEIFMCEENPQMGAIATQNQSFYLYVPNADEAMKQATKAGCKELKPAEDMFWGDRNGTVADSFGIKWTLATHVRDVSPQELEEAVKKMAGKAA